jgi:hypothetical protein
MKKYLPSFLLLLGAIIFIVLGMSRLVHYRYYRSLEYQNRNLWQGIQEGERIIDPYQAVAHFQKLIPRTPEVQLRILQRQWAIGLDLLQQIHRSSANSHLTKDVPALYTTLNTHLDVMAEECSGLLSKSEALPDEIAWRVYNIRGSVKLLTAFSVLETERNWKKVMGIMKEAISDLKSAIASVDRTNTLGLDRNVPRWNLELLQGEQFVKKFQLGTVTDDQRLELKDNLEAIIPERGGYAPGEPVERRVLK